MGSSSSRLLDRDAVESIVDIVTQLGLYPDRRAAVLAGLPSDVRAQLPSSPIPSDQLRLDVDALNDRGWVSESGPPLGRWLASAIQISGPRQETELLARYSARMGVEHGDRARLEALEMELDELECQRAPQAEIAAKWGEICALKRAARRGESLQVGQVLEDRFALINCLGSGGFGEVWAARDKHLRSRVAVKVMHGHLTRDASQRDRMLRGARAMRQLAAIDGIVGVHDVIESEVSGRVIIVLQFIDGCDLDSARHHRLDQPGVIALIRAIALAIGHAHQRGMVHRDIKPGNILVDTGGRPWLTDFDLVYLPYSTAGTRSVLGTLNFIAPEAVSPGLEATAATDVYGLGITALFLLSRGTLPNIMARDAREAFLAQLDLAPHVAAVLGRAVDQQPTRRYPDGHAFAGALDGLLQEHATLRPWRPPMCEIPSGTFDMGDDSDARAAPLHLVELSEDFWVSATPVSRRQLQAVTGSPGPGDGEIDGPALGLTWFEAVRFCIALSEREGLTSPYSESEFGVAVDWRADGYRLPTEAEWERAARLRESGSTAPSLGIPAGHGEWCADVFTDLTGKRAVDPRFVQGPPRQLFFDLQAPAETLGLHPAAMPPRLPMPLSSPDDYAKARLAERVVRGLPSDGSALTSRHRRQPYDGHEIGFRVTRRKPTALEQVPCPQDDRHFLVWQRRGEQYFTTWLTAAGGRIAVRVNRWPELLLGAGERLWRGEAVPVHAWFEPRLDPAFDPLLMRAQTAFRLIDPMSGDVLPESAARWGQVSPCPRTDGEPEWGVFGYSRKDQILGAVGHICLYRCDEFFDGGGSCGHPDVDFQCLDLSTGAPVDLVEQSRAAIEGDAEVMAVARSKWLAARRAGEPDTHAADRLELTQVGYRFTLDGRLGLDYQLTGLAECHADTDGSAGCTMRSVWVESDYIPEALRGLTEMPEPVRIWFERNPTGFIGWTALPDTERVRVTLESLLSPPRL